MPASCCDTIGVDLDKVASGPLKAEPDIDEPMTAQVRASLAALVDDSFQWFVDIVAERRGLTAAGALALADGRIITGRQGVDTKLIDAIGGEARGHRLARSRQDSRRRPAGRQPSTRSPSRGLAGIGNMARRAGARRARACRAGPDRA